MLLYAEAYLLIFEIRREVLDLESWIQVRSYVYVFKTPDKKTQEFIIFPDSPIGFDPAEFPPSQAYRRIKFDRCTINRLLSKILSSQPKEAVNDLE